MNNFFISIVLATASISFCSRPKIVVNPQPAAPKIIVGQATAPTILVKQPAPAVKIVMDKKATDAAAPKIVVIGQTKKDAAVKTAVQAPAASIAKCATCGSENNIGECCYNGIPLNGVPRWFAESAIANGKNPATAWEYYSTHGAEK